MNQEIVQTNQESLEMIVNLPKKADALYKMGLPQFKGKTPQDIILLLTHAQQLGINELEAINGSLYVIQGKVGMSATFMNRLIRKRGHSITQLQSKNGGECILRGRRADNGDVMIVSFTFEEAKRSGLVRQGGSWEKYASDMLFARCLSRLARRLFPDVIGEAGYTDYDLKSISPEVELNIQQTMNSKRDENILISDSDVVKIEALLEEDDELKKHVFERLKSNYNIEKLGQLSISLYKTIYEYVIRKLQKKSEEAIKKEEIQHAV